MSQMSAQDIQNAENALERLVSGLPGFQGYRAKEHRRDADKILRLHIAERLTEQWRRLTEIQRQMASSGEFTYLDDLEGIAIRLRSLADQIRTASYGYAGFFDAVKVDDAALQRLYTFDTQLLDLVEAIKAGVDQLEQALQTDQFPQAMRDLLAQARQAQETFNRREETILGD